MRKAQNVIESTLDKTPSWVFEMHQHYRATGTYRSEDVARVLGDQKAEVKGEAAPTLLAASVRRT